MSTADHTACCCTETLTDLRALKAPAVTLSRTHDGPATPDVAVPGPSGALGRPVSDNLPRYAGVRDRDHPKEAE